MEFIGAMLELRGLGGFMENLSVVDEEINERRTQFEELASRMYGEAGEAWLKPKAILQFCEPTDDGNGQALFGDIITSDNEAARSRSLSKYILAPDIGELARVGDPESTEDDAEKWLVLEHKQDNHTKNSTYRFAVHGPENCGGRPLRAPQEAPTAAATRLADTSGTSGSTETAENCGARPSIAVVENRAPHACTAPETYARQGNSELCGDSGDKPYGSSIVRNITNNSLTTAAVPTSQPLPGFITASTACTANPSETEPAPEADTSTDTADGSQLETALAAVEDVDDADDLDDPWGGGAL